MPTDLRVLSAMPLLPGFLFLAQVKKVKMSSDSAQERSAPTRGGLTHLVEKKNTHGDIHEH